MGVNTPVVDRAPRYPGRVRLNPVSGQPNVYDMTRADQPTNEGTPINKALLDQKAYTLTNNVTVYVAPNGNDTTGKGTFAAPYKTIQRAVDDIPKCLGGFHAVVDIAEGTYPERVTVSGFKGGRLTLGVDGRSVTVNGIYVMASSIVRVYISNIAPKERETAFYVGGASNVLVLSSITINGASIATNGIGVEQNSTLAATGADVTVNDFVNTGILALTGGKAAFGAINGNSAAGAALRVDSGAVVTYVARNITAPTAQLTAGGGRIYSGAQSNIPIY